MIRKTKEFLQFALIACIISSCGGHGNNAAETDESSGTPVRAISASKSGLKETIELNATSSFLLKTPLKSIATGFLQNVMIKQGDFVSKGQPLMNVITKEAQSIGSTLKSLDTLIQFNGQITIKAPANGYISLLNFQNGDYVQDGEQIALISDSKSFVFILELPYELTPLVRSNKNVKLLLPDSTQLDGTLDKPMPTVNANAQTQNYLISVNTEKLIPENLVARVILVKSSRQSTQTLPKEAILTDETQSKYWVMKLENDTTAIKISVTKGIETADKVEILSPQFSESDLILISGNYGLPDTAKIQLLK